MAVRDIDHHDIDSGAQELRGALEIIAFRAYRRADPKPPLIVARREGQLSLPDEILRGDEPQQHVVCVDQRQLLDLLRAHHLFRRGKVRRAALNDQPLARRHARCHGALRTIDETEVAAGEQPLQPPAAVGDDERSDAGGAHPGCGVGKAGVGRDRVGIRDDAVLLPLDDLDLAHLRLDFSASEPAIDDADAAFFGHGDRHFGSRHRIHVRGDDRPLQRDARGEPAGEIDGRRVAPLDDAVLRVEQKIVKGRPANEINQ
jgi:hypothetical protein